MSKLVDFFRLSAQVKRMMLEAYLYSAKFRYKIMHKPFRDYANEIGTFQYETPRIRISDQVIADTEWAVNAACKRATWDSKCLDRALTAKKILNRRGYPCTMYMGVRMDEKKEMTAHAWLRCGTNWVAGGNGEGYAVTGIYGDKEELKKKIYSAEYLSVAKADRMDDTGKTDEEFSNSVHIVSCIEDIDKWFSAQSIEFLLLPLEEFVIRLLVREESYDNAVAILKAHYAEDTSIQADSSVGSCFSFADQKIMIQKKSTSDYNEKFGTLWKRRKEKTIGNSMVSTLGDVDEVCDLFRIMKSGKRDTEAAQKAIEGIIKEQSIPLDLLYNHMQSRNLHHELIQTLIAFYRTSGNILKPYNCVFLSIEAQDDCVLVQYDKMIDMY